jgi:hypothetical protein
MARTVLDLSGNVVKADGFEGTVENPAVTALTANASTAHALNATFSDTEVEAALNALGTKINAIITALKA